MNETAKSLFADWYTAGIKNNASADEMKPKREAIEKILSIKDRAVWTDVLLVYLGFLAENEDGFKRVAQYFKDADEYFQLKNVHLLRLLSGCAIAEKLDANDSWVSDFLALAIIVQPLRTEGIVPELPERALAFYVRECEKKRGLAVRANAVAVKTALPKPVQPAMADHTSIPEFIKQLGTYLTGTTKDVTQLITAINQLIGLGDDVKTAIKGLSEETDVLWWLFGEHSSLLKKPFNTASPELLAVLVGIELQELTAMLPGIGKVSAIIAKALGSVTHQADEEVALELFIEATHAVQAVLDQSLPAIPGHTSPICPLLFALRTYLQYSGNEWKEVLTKAGINPAERKYTRAAFAGQLYRELMIIRVYNEIGTV